MSRKPINKSTLTRLADAAFEQASRQVVLRAQQTGTPVIVWKDGQIQELPSESIKLPPDGNSAAQPKRNRPRRTPRTNR